jgi:hypothetical protein
MNLLSASFYKLLGSLQMGILNNKNQLLKSDKVSGGFLILVT